MNVGKRRSNKITNGFTVRCTRFLGTTWNIFWHVHRMAGMYTTYPGQSARCKFTLNDRSVITTPTPLTGQWTQITPDTTFYFFSLQNFRRQKQFPFSLFTTLGTSIGCKWSFTLNFTVNFIRFFDVLRTKPCIMRFHGVYGFVYTQPNANVISLMFLKILIFWLIIIFIF